MNQHKQRILYILTDWISCNITWLIFNIFRYTWSSTSPTISGWREYLCWPSILTGQIVMPLCFVFIFFLSGYYNRPYLKSRLQEVVTTINSTIVCAILVFFLLLIDDVNLLHLNDFQSVLTLYFFLFILIYIPRFIITQRSTRRIHRKEIGKNTLIIGTQDEAIELYNDITYRKNGMGFFIQGFIALENEKPYVEGESLIGKIEDIDSIIKEKKTEQLILVIDQSDKRIVWETINRLYSKGLPIYIPVANYQNLISNVKINDIANTPLVDITRSTISDSGRNIKRVLDILISLAVLILFSPLYAAIALVIIAQEGFPVIFKQERLGRNRKPFIMYKFRTMVSNAELSGPRLSQANDIRVTSLGRFLRKYRLDELPQFWNVLKGDMSLVGPRPERAYFADQLTRLAPQYSILYQVRPGITSWGMVKYGYAENINQMLQRMKYDILYVENRSLTIDLKIVIYTFKTVFTGKGI